MVDLTGSRLRMLEAFQRNGYSCSYSKNYGFAVSGENGYSICCHSFKEYKHYFSVNIKVIRNIDTYYNEERVLQSSIDLSYSTFEEDFKVKVLNWLVKGGFLLKTPSIVLNKSKEELTEFFYLTLSNILKEKGISSFPQSLDDFTTEIVLDDITELGLESIFSYRLIITQTSIKGVYKHIENYKGVSPHHLYTSFSDNINHLIERGYLTNYSIEDAFKEYLTFLEKDDVLKAFVFAMDLGSKRNQLDYKRKKHPLTFHLVE